MLFLPCLFHTMTGWYCPGCGGTRAFRYLLRGEWFQSFRYHPLILYHLITSGIDRSNIARLMGVTDGTLRQRKFRLVRKLEMLTSGQAL